MSADRRASAFAPWLVFGATAALSGAAGLAVQLVLLHLAAPCVGQGRVGTLGVGAYVCGWSLGAWLAGRLARSPAAGLAAAALAVPVTVAGGVVALPLLAWFEGLGPVALPGALATLALVALPQGAVLPLLVRALERASGRALGRGIGALYGLNLVGAVAGAWWGGHGPFALSVPLAVGTGGAALAALLLAGIASRAWRAGGAESPRAGPEDAPLTPRRAALLVGFATAWMLGLETVVVRLGVLHLGGMQLGLSALLAAALTALTLGAVVLGPWTPTGPRGVLALLALAAVGSLWPFAFRVAERPESWAQAYALAVLLAGPALAPFGAVVPALHRSVAGEGARRLGGLLLHESWGALLGAVLTVQVLVPRLGLGGALATWCVLGALAAASLARVAPRPAALAMVVAALCAAVAAARPAPALSAAPLANPALAIRSFEEDEHFAVTVVDDGLLGERTLLTDEFRAAGTGRDYAYMRALGHLPLLLHPAPRRVAVLALGTGTTVGAVSLHPGVERVDVLEISRAVVAAAPWFEDVNRGALAEGLPGLLDEGDGADRVVVRLGDGRRTLAEHGPHDVVTMEPLLPSSPFGVHLYTREFYAVVDRALAPGGLVCQWIPPHALRPEVFDVVLHTARARFAWSGVWVFGTQVLVVAGDAPPRPRPEAWEALPDELAAELAALGLGSLEEVLAREVGTGRSVDSGSLSDTDPWILRGPRRDGAERLADLPRNLRSVEGVPWPWHGVDSPALERARAGRAALRAARRAHAWLEVAAVDPGFPVDAGEADRRYLEERLGRAADLLGDDAELRELAEHVEFLDRLRRGVGLLGALARGEPVEPRAVVDPLTRAAELRPERGDVHAYDAAAFALLGFDEAARKAAAVAVERCPRIAATPAGRRAIALGLPAAYLAPPAARGGP